MVTKEVEEGSNSRKDEAASLEEGVTEVTEDGNNTDEVVDEGHHQVNESFQMYVLTFMILDAYSSSTSKSRNSFFMKVKLIVLFSA